MHLKFTLDLKKALCLGLNACPLSFRVNRKMDPAAQRALHATGVRPRGSRMSFPVFGSRRKGTCTAPTALRALDSKWPYFSRNSVRFFTCAMCFTCLSLALAVVVCMSVQICTEHAYTTYIVYMYMHNRLALQRNIAT